MTEFSFLAELSIKGLFLNNIVLQYKILPKKAQSSSIVLPTNTTEERMWAEWSDAKSTAIKTVFFLQVFFLHFPLPAHTKQNNPTSTPYRSHTHTHTDNLSHSNSENVVLKAIYQHSLSAAQPIRFEDQNCPSKLADSSNPNCTWPQLSHGKCSLINKPKGN